MKKFIFALAFVIAPCAVNAGEILPNLYAQKFCEYRALGISVDDSRKAAVKESYIPSGSSVMVNYNGKMFSSDALNAALLVVKMCPEFVD
jgi:hypothetical protein